MTASRPGAAVVRGVMGLVLLVAVATLVFWVLNLGTPGAETDFGTRFSPPVSGLVGLAFAVVGGLIVSRRPGNAVGLVCLVIGFMSALNSFAIEFSIYAMLTEPGSLPGGMVAAWLANWTWVIYVGLMGTVLVLLFPDGRLPSPRWRPVMAAALLAMTMAATGFALAPGQFVSVPWANNPFGVRELAGGAGILESGFFLLALTIPAAAVSMVLRFRRSRGVERQQIKWFASAASLLAVVYVGQAFYAVFTGTLGNSTGNQRIFQTAIIAVFGVLAASVGIAVLRYRLYQIDHVISRTVGYAVITGALGALYVVLAFGLGQIVPANSDIAVAASTLAVAALFAPLRRRVQERVDRRFNRSRYDAARTLERFSERLRHATDLSTLRGDLLGITGRIMEPAHLSVWLREMP
ncbi:MAG TPA: hypothetical protein VHL52_06920 [Acidimicrobiia bacterium]|nr:hypothetical protein [Acidimicrobiia bacterium]